MFILFFMNERRQIMRAKEYIACSEASLKHPADIRLQACLLQKELYEKNNAMQTAEPEEFQMKEGEIPVEIAASVRDELFDVIKEDKTFGHLYSCWGTFATASGRPTR